VNSFHLMRKCSTTTLAESGVHLTSGTTPTIKSVVKTLIKGNN